MTHVSISENPAHRHQWLKLSGSQYMYQKVDLFQSYRDHSPLRHPNQ
jgi:hypothetical protein